jgi:deoxyhypusine synthase
MASKTDFMAIPTGASAAVLQRSDPISDNAISVQGPNFDTPLSLLQFLQSYERIGFQANSLGRAIDIVNKMVGSPSIFCVSLFEALCCLSGNGVCPTNHWLRTNRTSI